MQLILKIEYKSSTCMHLITTKVTFVPLSLRRKNQEIQQYMRVIHK